MKRFHNLIKAACCIAGYVYVTLAFVIAVSICPYVMLAGVFLFGDAPPDDGSPFYIVGIPWILASALCAGYPIAVLTSIGMVIYKSYIVIYKEDNSQRYLYNTALSFFLPLLPFFYLISVLCCLFCACVFFTK